VVNPPSTRTSATSTVRGAATCGARSAHNPGVRTSARARPSTYGGHRSAPAPRTQWTLPGECRSAGPAASGSVLDPVRALQHALYRAAKADPRRRFHLEVGGEGVDFLGFHHRLVRAWARTGSRQVTFLARWPASKAMQHARDRIRELCQGHPVPAGELGLPHGRLTTHQQRADPVG
jgi:hypothetical protein